MEIYIYIAQLLLNIGLGTAWYIDNKKLRGQNAKLKDELRYIAKQAYVDRREQHYEPRIRLCMWARQALRDLGEKL